MFTGIIEETGRIKSVSRGGNSAVLSISCSRVLEDTKTGDSIAVNGVCLTATTISDDGFTADLSFATLENSSLKNVKSGDRVNLERALTLNTRLGGHLVSGHVDGLGIVEDIKPMGESYLLSIRFPEEISRYITDKGSICVDGISLTTSAVRGNIFDVAVIPHTYKETTLSDRARSHAVNLEVDVIARYLEKLLKKGGGNDTLSGKLLDLDLNNPF
ncbi:riboflavin synthase [Limisalsivibrio acetivorans]|uniref:riboflavin synthase n=1 Tax=Limisalsivibrio acetivorans TaxID=1304888 RepID=UPI0003B36054|nr:riboflavin synthase [Limisalsivibrio acetivorans]